MRVVIDKVQIDSVTMQDTVEQIAKALDEHRTHSLHVATANAQFIQIARSNPRFAEVLTKAELSVADGVSLVWASRLLGAPLPGRVNGTDLMVRLCQESVERGWSVFFFAGRPGAADAAARVLGERYPGLRVAGTDCPPMGFTEDAELDRAAACRIESAAPDLLFVGLGAPKQELWIDAHRTLPAGVMVGVGGSFELVAGMIRRAPLLFQRAGLEWLWRLCMEPGRLWKRYLIGNTFFILLVFRQWLSKMLAVRQRSTVPSALEKEAE